MGWQRGTRNRSDRCVSCQGDTISLLLQFAITLLLLLLLRLLLIALLLLLLLDLRKASR